jgi:hypothetical protein
MAMPRKTVHVVPNNKIDGWSVKKGGAERASVNTDTKAEAVKIGRVMSQRTESELVIHGKNGKIQRSDSHGNDPCPPKD